MSGHGNYGYCPKCKKQVIWIRTPAGKNMPCNSEIKYYKEEAGGKDRIVLPNGQVVAGTILKGPEFADGYGYTSHFATCEFSQMFRRKKKVCLNRG